YALGLTAATGRPTVLISTSGTAGANFYPAIIEASKKKLPLIVITADRPPELRFTGANQTIDQVKMFGDYVRFFFDMPCPNIDINPAMVLTTIDQLIYQAKSAVPGPVHLNCMFRDPLYNKKGPWNKGDYLADIKQWQQSRDPFTIYMEKTPRLNRKDILNVAAQLNKTKNGLIVVGKLKNSDERNKILSVSKKLNWPIFPDITSGLRTANENTNTIHHFDQILQNEILKEDLINNSRIETVLHAGGRMTSKRYYQFMEKLKPARYITVLNHSLRNDPLHGVTVRVESPVDVFCEQILPHIKIKKENNLMAKLKKWSRKIDAIIQNYLDDQQGLSEMVTARLISQMIPKGSGLFLGNSLPIRNMDMFADAKGNNVIIGGNRGASGIDGTIASGLGFAKGLNKHCTTFSGDLAFLHDVNSLGIADSHDRGHILIVINNDGGGIFSLLPIAGYKKHFTEYFTAPHGHSFSHAAAMFGWEYENVNEKKSFTKTYKMALKSKSKIVIEINTKKEDNVKNQKQIESLICARIKRS
ncbi:MAG: 2-succinyl-5-enolpyruvyl-6-hydroxy-3-cyclohexene-1-carboxylic-acid synthase, partial [Candidatus Omnitrophica bacterium]|nr:2-succinyl-5-enolpyruvyl-6-hydroxy-3-cyclohexene-1-carboxylic-acid synthase [Candidatus Omnitrophota bacterium]